MGPILNVNESVDFNLIAAIGNRNIAGSVKDRHCNRTVQIACQLESPPVNGKIAAVDGINLTFHSPLAGNILTVEIYLAGGRLVGARNDVEQRGLARAVGTDQPGDRTLFDFQRGTVDGADSPEMHVQVDDGYHGSKKRPEPRSPGRLSINRSVD